MGEQGLQHTSSAPNGFISRLRIEHIWAVLPPFLLAVVSFGNQLRLLDFWWHLKAGEVIVQSWSIPRVDPFSFTAAGQPYILQNWLAEVLYFLSYKLGGFALLRTLNSVILVGTLALVLHLCWDSVRNVRKSAAAVLLLLVPLTIYSSVRPQVFSFFFFAAFYWFLDRFDRKLDQPLWPLPFMMVLWVNLHGAFVLGLGLMGLFGGSLLVRQIGLKAVGSPVERRFWKFAAFAALCSVSTLLNPEGLRVYSYVLGVLSDPGSQRFVTEWQPPQINDAAGLLCFFGPLALSLLLFLYSRRLCLLELLLFFGFAAFGLTALRNGIWLAVILPPLVGRRLPTLGLEVSSESRLPRRPAASHTRVNLAFLALLGLVLVSVSPWVHPSLTRTSQWEKATPVQVFDFIEAEGLSGHIFHPQMYGDYLIWRLWPNQRSFVDGRVHLFGEKVIRDYFEIFADSCWEDRLAAYGIEWLLLEKDSRQSRKLEEAAGTSPGWVLRYEDDLCVLYGRRRSPGD